MLTTVHLWRLPAAAVPAGLARLVGDRPALHRLSFAKLLGTGQSFAVGRPDLRRWVLIACFGRRADAEAFEGSRAVRGWDRLATERARYLLAPLSCRGQWSGRHPFGAPSLSGWDGPVAAITRARLAAPRAWRFWRAVPAVAADLAGRDGLALALAIGEAPAGWQGTFSIWRDAGALTAFAYQGTAHRQAVVRTPGERWYAEELFARFAVLAADGRLASQPAPTGLTLPT